MSERARLEAMAGELEASGEYVVLRRIPRLQLRQAPQDADLRRGLFIDVETTGLRSDSDEIIELAMVPFHYDNVSGLILEVFEPFAEFNDPGRRIPRAIVELTGITDADVRGKRIDLAEVRRI